MARYDMMRYWATHNSYEGGDRGWIPGQLDRKVRCLELDIWDNDYEEFGDFRLGHFKPGHAVARGAGNPGENPNTLLLRDWLKTIGGWSAANPGHAAITLVLDVKSDLTDNDDAGDLEDLNQKLEKAFGTKLFTRDDYGAGLGQWPETTALRDRVICVLSGNTNTRSSYRYCFGQRPAIAASSSGRVVIAYRSTGGDMRYWSGKAKVKSKVVEWERKGTYAFSPYTVSEPAIAMADDGWIVSVHRIGPRPGEQGPALLESKVGELQDDGRIIWYAGASFSEGMQPSVELASATKVREIHTTPSGKSLRLREGTLNRARKKVEWKDSEATEGPAFPRDSATWNGHELRCLTNASGMMLCAFDGSQMPVRYRQVAFVELQSQEDRTELVDPLFYGASAADRAAIEAARRSGLTARAWWFKDGHRTEPPSPPQENTAATDHPFSAWYQPYMDAGGQTEF